MTKTLRTAVEKLIRFLDVCVDEATQKVVVGGITVDVGIILELKQAYREQRAIMTETSRRVEFLEGCLETGVSKREAARMLVNHDPRISKGTAETLVYLNFSGRYCTSLRGRRLSTVTSPTMPIIALPDLNDEEAIL